MADAVSVTNLRIEYESKHGSVRAVENASLSVRSGELVALLGPSGAGKTSILKAIAGLLEPKLGEIAIDGVTQNGPSQLVGLMFQSPVLLDWLNIRDNVSLAGVARGLSKKEASERAYVLLEQVGLAAFARHHPYELSGGMQQRVSLARALLMGSRLLLMDEPFGALDAMTREEMGFLLQDVWFGSARSVILVTHNVEEAVLLADRVLILTSSPSIIAETMEVNVPRPRTTHSKRHLEYRDTVDKIYDALERDTARSPASTGSFNTCAGMVIQMDDANRNDFG